MCRQYIYRCIRMPTCTLYSFLSYAFIHPTKPNHSYYWGALIIKHDDIQCTIALLYTVHLCTMRQWLCTTTGFPTHYLSTLHTRWDEGAKTYR